MTKTHEELYRWVAASDPAVIDDPLNGTDKCYYCKVKAHFVDSRSDWKIDHAPDCWYTWCREWVKKPVRKVSRFATMERSENTGRFEFVPCPLCDVNAPLVSSGVIEQFDCTNCGATITRNEEAETSKEYKCPFCVHVTGDAAFVKDHLMVEHHFPAAIFTDHQTLEQLADIAAGDYNDPNEAFDAMVKRMGNYGRSELADIRELDPLRMDELVCIKCGCRAAECVCKQVTGAEPV